MSGHHHHHGHDHNHEHSNQASLHTHGPFNNERRTFWAMILTGSFMLVEFVGGFVSGSLALMSDAIHMLTDMTSLGLAWFAFKLMRKPSDAKRSYGYHRFEIVAAFANAVAMIVVVGWISVEAIHRLLKPHEIMGNTMFIVACLGFIVNAITLKILHGADQHNLNIKGAVLHVIGDLLGSFAAILAAIIIMWTGWLPIDPLLSVLISLLVLRTAWDIIKKSGHILLEGAPDWMPLERLEKGLKKHVPDVLGIHHVHVWSLSSDQQLMTIHVHINPQSLENKVLHDIKDYLKKDFGITHTTIQLETEEHCPDHEDPDQHYVKEEHAH
jgi:cobalt-zinc-cadmium efflux system protein